MAIQEGGRQKKGSGWGLHLCHTATFYLWNFLFQNRATVFININNRLLLIIESKYFFLNVCGIVVMDARFFLSQKLNSSNYIE